MKNAQNRVSNIDSLLRSAERDLKKASSLLHALKEELETSYDDVPGTLGIFDGTHMTTPDGKKYEVNPNYVAKSLLVAGDNLKMVEDNGKQLFKQVSKIERKRLDGILNKKEGSWYALTDSGSYRLLDTAVEYRRGEVNDELVVLVPADNLNVEWAALEKMKKEDLVKKESVEAKVEAKPSAPVSAAAKSTPAKPVVAKPAAKKEPKKEEKKEDKRPVIRPVIRPPRGKSGSSGGSSRGGGGRKPSPSSASPARRKDEEPKPRATTTKEAKPLLDDDLR